MSATSEPLPHALPADGAETAPTWPGRCDVLVIGAGPAGSACAQRLAAAGIDVVLVDQHTFPRDKICGDGLIPDAHAAFRALGVYDELSALWQPAPHVRCVGPRGKHCDVPGAVAVLPRKVLDEVLVRAAQRAGARLLTPLRFEAPLEDAQGRAAGARLRAGDHTHEIQARWVVLATGAVPQALTAAGMCERHTPSGVALRTYIRHPGLASTIRQLQFVWHPRMRGGYGWIFPCPGGVFNIGAGHPGSHRTLKSGKGQMQDLNLRRFFETFAEVYEPARRLVAEGERLSELKGAPLRCSLLGARWTRRGLLVTGEAAGSTYAFSGEGIGKAMETGLLAADALLASPQVQGQVAGDDADIRQRYETGLLGLKPKFDLYERAARVNDHPWLADLVIWRANKSARIMARMSAVIEERQNPGWLLSFRGMRKLLTE
ncbi:MAG: geranylgeranyl reductase family protein [Rubrivivax sp.]|nr:geranylgeranyl reductase family protein [Rubrivivax sp.]